MNRCKERQEKWDVQDPMRPEDKHKGGVQKLKKQFCKGFHHENLAKGRTSIGPQLINSAGFMKKLTIFLALLLASAVAWAQVKVVYDLSEGNAQSARAIANMRNHLDADPSAKIVVVAHGAGIEFLLDGAVNPKGQPFAGDIGELAGRGVEFHVCNNTLKTRNVSKDRVAMEATVIPSGVVEIANLQFKEHYAYIHP